MLRKTLIYIGAAVVVIATVGVGWLVASYHWCPFGQSLQITRKTGGAAARGQYASPGEQGVLEQMRGPGRHFLNPWDFSIKPVNDVVIRPGQIATVKNNIGKDMPSDRFIAGPDEKGTQRYVLTPGVWRINEFGQEVKLVSATMIPPGYVGVQTLKEGKTKGILPTVLQAGYYNINPVETEVTPIEIGFHVWDVHTEFDEVQAVEDGSPKTVKVLRQGTGVSFPLADGKEMHLDFTVVWGVFPEDAPRIIREYGTMEMVEQKIIGPQVDSICKNAGSNLTTKQFIEGAAREAFQDRVTEALQEMGREKGIHFLIALVRGFHPAEDIKATIQAQTLAEEEKITLRIEQQRETVAASLEQARRIVDVAIQDFDAETEALVQEEMERGIKQAEETKAAADRTVAQLARKTAEIKAQVVKILGQAEADVIEAIKKAEARRLELLIDAYGGAEPYNLAIFAESLPDDIRVEYRYAGEGTLWTDAAGDLIDLAAKKMLGAPAAK